MAATATSVTDVCRAVKRASRELAALETGVKDAALNAIADAIDERAGEILEANARDMEAGRAADLDAAFLDKLRLDESRVAVMARGVSTIVALPDPVGEVIDGFRLPNGLDVRRVRVPLGVVAIVYEARPNVTVDATALCLKSGNAIVLRGSSAAAHSNAVLAAIATEAATGAGIPDGAIGLVAGGGHGELSELATQDGLVDLIVPRGGEGLKAALSEVATVPILYAASGNCHVYVDAGADLDTAEAIVTPSAEAGRAFARGVDAACVYVNASTRFTDGGEFGMGAELGNSTQKLHARGPIGMRELCTYKYVVEGSGQVRS